MKRDLVTGGRRELIRWTTVSRSDYPHAPARQETGPDAFSLLPREQLRRRSGTDDSICEVSSRERLKDSQADRDVPRWITKIVIANLRPFGVELKNGANRGSANAQLSETDAASGSSGFPAPVECFERLLSPFEFLDELFLCR